MEDYLTSSRKIQKATEDLYWGGKKNVQVSKMSLKTKGHSKRLDWYVMVLFDSSHLFSIYIKLWLFLIHLLWPCGAVAPTLSSWTEHLRKPVLSSDPTPSSLAHEEVRSGPAGLLRNVPVGLRGVSAPIICSASLTRLKIWALRHKSYIYILYIYI